MSENKSHAPKRREGQAHGPGPGGMMMGGGEKARDFKGTMKKLTSYLSVYWFSMLIVLVFAIASSVFTIVGPKILGKATTELFEGVMKKISGTGEVNFDFIGKISILSTT